MTVAGAIEVSLTDYEGSRIYVFLLVSPSLVDTAYNVTLLTSETGIDIPGNLKLPRAAPARFFEFNLTAEFLTLL